MTAKYGLRVIDFTFDDLWKQPVLPRCIVGNSRLFLSPFANTSANKLPAFLIEMDHNLFLYFHCSLR